MSGEGIPVRGQAFVFYVGLRSQSNPAVMQSNPTLASGDAKVSLDGGALSNLATLPTVTPASGKMVKVSLSAAEMDADDVTVVLSDASGAEWCDIVIDIKPAGWLVPGAVNDASATTTGFVTNLASSTTDHYKGCFLVFTDGTIQNAGSKITAYNGATKAVTLSPALPAAPANNTPFVIVGRSD